MGTNYGQHWCDLCKYDFHTEKININYQETCLYWGGICVVQCYNCYWDIIYWY